MTTEKLRQRCLELGYSEEHVDRIIRDLRWGGSECFGRLFGSKYDDEDALRNVLDNWIDYAMIMFNAMSEYNKEHPELYNCGKDVDAGEILTCYGFSRGFHLTDEEIEKISQQVLEEIEGESD